MPIYIKGSGGSLSKEPPVIEVDANGLVTAKASGLSATHQLSTKEAETIIPSTSDQIISSGYYLTGNQTIKGDANLQSYNIKSGVSIFGVNGNLAEGDGGISLPTLTNEGVASDLRADKQLIDSSGNIVSGNIVSRTESDVTVDSNIVSIPVGIYDSDVSKSVSTVEQATPSISIDSSGLITASSTQSAGYVSSGTKSSTKQLATKDAETITPSTSNQTINSGTYLTGTQTILGDTNLKPENIKSGVSIFGVTGQLEEGWELAFFSTDSRYPSSDIFSERYVNDLGTHGYLNMYLNSYISDYKVVSVCAVYDDTLLTLMLTQLPELVGYDVEDFPLGGFRYWETDDDWGYEFDDAVSCQYSAIGPNISVSLGGTQYPFSPDHVYVYIAIKR